MGKQERQFSQLRADPPQTFTRADVWLYRPDLRMDLSGKHRIKEDALHVRRGLGYEATYERSSLSGRRPLLGSAGRRFPPKESRQCLGDRTPPYRRRRAGDNGGSSLAVEHRPEQSAGPRKSVDPEGGQIAEARRAGVARVTADLAAHAKHRPVAGLQEKVAAAKDQAARRMELLPLSSARASPESASH